MNAEPGSAPSRRWHHAGGALVLLAGLTAATYPVWRVALLGSRPTLEELLRLTCSASGPAGPPQWLVQRGVFGQAPADAALPSAVQATPAQP